MASNFPKFSKIVADSFQQMTKASKVFVADIDKHELFDLYLKSFPEGTNLLFKERSEYDCSCCRQFVYQVGATVSIKDNGEVVTVWDEAAEKAEHPFNIVASALRDAVKSAPIADIFVVKERGFGAKNTFSEAEDGSAIKWNHFYSGDIPSGLRSNSPGENKGSYRTTVQVFERGLEQLSSSALDTVLELIDSNSLYRGEEHRQSVLEFRKMQNEYKSASNKNAFAWLNAQGRAARFRNTVIGTLVTDLSEGVDIEKAVRSFESKVAPYNYKRTSAVITPGMVKAAMATINELELEPALERRFARIDDIAINDVLWADSTVEPLMKGGLGEELMKHAQKAKELSVDESKAEDISIDDFVSNILPQAQQVMLLLKGEHLGNLVSLTAPVHSEPQQLFSWGNDFAWSYNGNITDSIKERVKKAGGRVTDVALRTSLSWWNTDDLDIHVIEPSGTRINYNYKRSPSGGYLDVDMNVSNAVRDAVENVSWPRTVDGAYQVIVNNYTLREREDVGFTVEVECRGKLHHFHYNKMVGYKDNVHVVTLHMKDGKIDKMDVGADIITNTIKQEKWGLTTENYIKVNAVTLSPNYWEGNAVGNKHHIFLLDGALNDEPTRGIYNEFLHPRLTKHRKVFEVIGEKTKCQPTEGQLSGVGFSSTKKASVIVKVTQGKQQRLFNVQVGHGQKQG